MGRYEDSHLANREGSALHKSQPMKRVLRPFDVDAVPCQVKGGAHPAGGGQGECDEALLGEAPWTDV